MTCPPMKKKGFFGPNLNMKAQKFGLLVIFAEANLMKLPYLLLNES